MVKHFVHNIFITLTSVILLSSCSDIIDAITGGHIEAGEKVMFTTLVPDQPGTRTAKEDWEKKVKAYNAVQEEYAFKISMFKYGDDIAKATSIYVPKKAEDEEGNRYIPELGDGTLELQEGETNDYIYWQDNVNRWGFKAESISSENIESDQSDQEKWLFQDKLVGYSYLPIWNDEADEAKDDFDKINYRTSKQWYKDNQIAKELSGIMVSSNEDYKKIPLYLQHQRSWITIILKADEGVTREALAFATSADNIITTIYSYKNGASTPTEITNAWSREEFIDYVSDKNGGEASHVSTTRYDAIVEPHNYIASAESQEKDIIARINVSNQNFTFAAAQDGNYKDFIAAGGLEGTEDAKKAMEAYNLEPGKHLTITATLSRKSRMVMITAWIEDWIETVTQTICDDYGNNGDPILIEDEAQLIDFLTNEEKNKPGNVGMIVPDKLPLSSTWDFSNYNLKATLNLAGCQFTIDKQFVKNIERTGSIVNGEILIRDVFSGEAAITTENRGTIERIKITTSGEQTPAFASKAGIAVDNYGTIYQCTSVLPVKGTKGYVGGIAARNIKEGDNLPVIDYCTVNARVDGGNEVTAGGGIAGEADGRVSNNTFEYGITLSQDSRFKNIIAVIGSNGLTTHTNNSWPIKGDYAIGSTNIQNYYIGTTYNAVIDNQDELMMLLESGKNNSENIYRIAKSFDVNKDLHANDATPKTNWIWGESELKDTYFDKSSTDAYSHGNVKFKLNGNNKTITLTGNENATMLFGNIMGEVYDLNIVLDKPIIAKRIMTRMSTDSEDIDSNTDAISAFAYAVIGSGTINKITIKAKDSNAYIQSSTPAGIAVWVSDGGTIMNCASNVPIKLQLASSGADARRYAGGLVACAEKATILQCKYYNETSTAITWFDDNARTTKCNYGGIVGGTSEIANAQNNPSLTLTDCTSWWSLPTFEEGEARPTMGSIIGTTTYHQNELVFNAMEKGNAGNWWNGNIGAGLYANGVTEAQVIGRKNSVQPSKPTGW